MNIDFKTALRSFTAFGLGISLSLCGLQSPTTASAAESGTITINQLHNSGATYDTYLVFKADISEDNEAMHVSWSSDAMKQVVLPFLDANDYETWLTANHPDANQHDRAQNACEYIAYMITGSATDTTAATTPRTTQARTFATELARTLANNNAAPHQTATSGEAFTGPEGYYLFVTTDTTTTSYGEAGTAPMWIPLGGSVTAIEEKSAVPTVNKEVYEDSKGEWGKVADANTGQAIDYRLTGTLPSNYGAFTTYHYRFDDTLESGLTIDVPSEGSIKDVISVTVGDRAAVIDGDELKASYENNKLTVEFKDLKDDYWTGFGINANTTITITYQAHMNTDRAIGSAGNLNGVYLTYTDDPVSDGNGRTSEVKVRVFAYKVTLHKVDEQTNEPLKGTGFVIRMADNNSDVASRGKYVQQDGSLGDSSYEFTTDDNGSFTVKGLDEGTYVFSEVTTPEGWKPIDADIVLTISSNLRPETLSIASLNGRLTGVDRMDVNAVNVTGVSAISGSAGSVTITATNDRWLAMPLTGRDGLGKTAAGGAVLAIGAQTVLTVRRRRMHA